MEVSPKTLREVEFREKMRGYHPEDVDQFLEQVASGIEVLQDRLRQAVERAQRAESAATESGGADETLRKTLVLAQRTADMAVQEAREQASRILASAEQQAQSILAEAEDRGRRTLEETIAECKAELGRLESNRTQAQQDVDTLQQWLDEHKEHLRSTLAEALSVVERAGVLWPAPNTRTLESRPAEAASRRSVVPAPPSVADLEPANGHADSGPDTMMWTPGPDHEEAVKPARALAVADEDADPEARPTIDLAASDVDPDQQALDDFFDDPDGDYDEERRFGGRLRRRR
ncbi:MAG TPA: DivIVA domain-containing protein [Acidimicrobiales bacterium]|nr:DivIVA domain-containing protein [Acidimicrobiales bacterium]